MDRRWPDGKVKCPRCGNPKVYTLKFKPFHWACGVCCNKPRQPYRFSVTVGTIFDNTKYPLKTWFEVLWQMLNSKKGVSALQIQRQIGCKAYRTAWPGICVIACVHPCTIPISVNLWVSSKWTKLSLAERTRNRHWDKKSHVTGGIGSGKVGVIGAISRKGNVVCQIIENTDAVTLNRFVRKAVSDKVDLVATDEHGGYGYLETLGYHHESVNHSAGEYVRGEVHTNNLENFWSLLKRGVIGTYHHVSKKYLPLYLAEFQFRHNNRKNADIFGEAIAGC